MTEKWIATLGTVLAVFAVVLVVAGASAPQTTPQFAKQADLQGLSTDVDGKFTALESQLAQRFSVIEEHITALNTQLATKASQDVVNNEIVGLRNQISLVDARVDESVKQVELHGEILDAISKPTSDGSHMPDLLSNMNDDVYQNDLKEIVGISIDDKSSVTIENRTAVSQRVYINEKDMRLLSPSEKWTVPVSTGNISTRIEGQDLVNWSVGPPRYSLDLAIENRGPVVTYYYSPSSYIVYP